MNTDYCISCYSQRGSFSCYVCAYLSSWWQKPERRNILRMRIIKYIKADKIYNFIKRRFFSSTIKNQIHFNRTQFKQDCKFTSIFPKLLKWPDKARQRIKEVLILFHQPNKNFHQMLGISWDVMSCWYFVLFCLRRNIFVHLHIFKLIIYAHDRKFKMHNITSVMKQQSSYHNSPSTIYTVFFRGENALLNLAFSLNLFGDNATSKNIIVFFFF